MTQNYGTDRGKVSIVGDQAHAIQHAGEQFRAQGQDALRRIGLSDAGEDLFGPNARRSPGKSSDYTAQLHVPSGINGTRNDIQLQASRATPQSHTKILSHPSASAMPDALNTILDDPSESHVLDPSYKLRSRKFFTAGRVFMILWSEPVSNSEPILRPGESFTLARFGQPVFSKVRRFVVLRVGSDSCSCVPILTYGQRGVAAQPDNRKSEHAVVFAGRMSEPLDSEKSSSGQTLLRAPIRVDLDSADLSLNAMSRINYGKVYTIEHNLKVRSLGRINKLSMDDFVNDFKLVWSDKISGRNSTGILGANNEETAKANHTTSNIIDKGKAPSTEAVQSETTVPLSQISEEALLEELLRRQQIVELMDTLADKLEPIALSNFCKRRTPNDQSRAGQSSSSSRPPPTPQPGSSTAALEANLLGKGYPTTSAKLMSSLITHGWEPLDAVSVLQLVDRGFSLTEAAEQVKQEKNKHWQGEA